MLRCPTSEPAPDAQCSVTGVVQHASYVIDGCASTQRSTPRYRKLHSAAKHVGLCKPDASYTTAESVQQWCSDSTCRGLFNMITS
jgi:hypothetical protein